MKQIRKKILPMLLVCLVLIGMFPATVSAKSPAGAPDISVESGTSGETAIDVSSGAIVVGGDADGAATSSGSTSTGIPAGAPDITVTPTEGSTPSSTPASGSTSESKSDAVESTASSGSEESLASADSADETGDGDGKHPLDGAPVMWDSGNMVMAQADGLMAAQSTGTLTLHKYDAYQWDFGFSHGGSDIKPWYAATIDGKLAYCIEPTNPDTTAGSYTTIDYNNLTPSQKYAIGYAMLYGAQDLSDVLFEMATQAVIWEIVYGYMDLTTFSATGNAAYNATIGHNPAAAAYYAQIVTAMRNHTQVPSFTRFVQVFAPLHQVPGIAGEYKLDLVNTNPNCNLADFSFANTGTVKFVREGQTLHVTSTGALDGNTIYGGHKGSIAETQSVIFWVKGDEQVRATAGHLDPVPAYMRLTTQDLGEYKITVIKLEAGTNSPLAGAEFEVRHSEKGVVGTYTTDGSGRLSVSVPWQGTYIVTEKTPPKNHLLDANPVKDIIISTAKPNATVTFHNESFSGIQITKVDATTKARIPGVTFRIARQGGGQHQDVVTGASGIAALPNLEPDYYTVQEISCPPGYILDSQIRTVSIKAGEVCEITIENYAKPSLEVRKIDGDTGKALAGATFRIAKKGSAEFKDITTGADGVARLTGMDPDYYTVAEIVAPDGYVLLSTPQTVEIVQGKVTSITVENHKKPGIQIQKVDADSGKVLAGATFRIAKKGGTEFKDIVSGTDGIARLTGMDPDFYIVTEIKAPDGYILNDTSQTIEIIAGKTATLTVQNSKKPDLEILKLDSITKQPLQYATFKISYKNGEVLGNFTTDENGVIKLVGLAPGLVVIEEILAPEGYIITNAPQEILLKGGERKTVTFENIPKTPVILKKVDSVTGEPLPGATFRLTKMNGELVGEYTTGRNGFITAPELQPGWYTAVETKAPAGYRLNNTPQNVELKLNGDPGIWEFENTALPGLLLQKIDSITKEPMGGVEFTFERLDGARIGKFTTDEFGYIFIENLTEKNILVRETKTLPGYIIDTAEKLVEIKEGILNRVEFTNTPYPKIELLKIDSVTGAPMAGVEFEISKMNGERIGTYTTDEDGRVFIEDIAEQTVKIRETKTLPRYLIDKETKTVKLEYGKVNTVTFTNTPYPKIELVKLDSVTEKPMAGVEFEIFTMAGASLGKFVTGEDGKILIEDIGEQTVKIRETKTLPGYKIDETERAIKLEYGKVNTVMFTNSPYPYLVIQKVDEGTGKPIPETEFKLMDAAGKEIGTYKTNQQGKIVLTGIDAGAYKLQETKAAAAYVLDDRVWDIALEWGKTTTITFKNTPLKIEVEVEKRGPVEAFAGQEIRYDFRNIANNSSVPLEQFYWHDLLPTDAVRLESIYTGTWGYENPEEKGKPDPAPKYADLAYKIVYRTNLKDNWTVLADNLSTHYNHHFVTSAQALKLAANEYVTEFKFEFGTVNPGFHEVKAPYILCRVLADLPNEYQFVNRTDVGGKYGDKWTYDKDAWVTITYSTPESKGKLPKTGIWL